MATASSRDDHGTSDTHINVGTQADEQLFTATYDLRNHGRTAAATPSVCSKVINSPIVRTLLVVGRVGLLIFLLGRLGGDSAVQEDVAQALRGVLKAGLQTAVALPVLEKRSNVTTTTAIAAVAKPNE
jgi:hypothetical protein